MPFFCAMCGMRCRSIVALKSHVKKQCGKVRGVSKTCEVCKIKFSHHRLLEIHRYHRHTHPKTELKCTECDKVFKLWHGLKRHVMSIHLQIKTHICDVCGKSFARKSYLTRHLLRHARKAAKYLATKEKSSSTSDTKLPVFGSRGFDGKQLNTEKNMIKRLKSVLGKIKKEKIERKKIRVQLQQEKEKRERAERKKIKREQIERINTKKETTEVKKENEEHKEKWQTEEEVFSSERVSSYNTEKMRNSKRICTRKRTASNTVQDGRSDNSIEPNKKKFRIEETNNSARCQDVRKCTENQMIESNNNRLKTNVRTISTRSTDVNESRSDYDIEPNKKRFQIEETKISTRSQDINECTEGQIIEQDNIKLKGNVRTIATRSTGVKNYRADNIRPYRNRFKIEETKGSARRPDLNECKNDRRIEPDNKRHKANVRANSTRSTDVKECNEEQKIQSDSIMLTTNVRRISKRVAFANDYKDNQTSGSGKKKNESVTREDSSKNINAKEKNQSCKQDEKKFENATRNDLEVHSDANEYKVNQSRKLDEKSLKTVERDNSGNSDMKEHKKNISSKLKEKQVEHVIGKYCTGSTDVNGITRDKSPELGLKKLKSVFSEDSAGSCDVKDCIIDRSSKKEREKLKKAVIKSSNESTDQNENTLSQNEKSNMENNVFDIRSSVESTEVKKCTEDQSREMDIGKLRMILMKNSETGEWSTYESLKKTVCTLEIKETASDNEEKKMCLSKDQPDVDKNVKYEKRCSNSIDRKQKRTKIQVENDNNKKFKGKKYDMNDKLCLLNEGKTRSRKVELTERKLIAKGSIEQNFVRVSNNPNPSTELTEYSSKDVVTVEFFEDRNSLFFNEIENANTSDAGSKDTDLTGENVDIKLIPYQNWCTDRKAIVKKEHIMNAVLTKDSTISDREDVNFSTADVVVIDCEDYSTEDCNSDIGNHVGDQARFRKSKNEHTSTKKKPEKISPPLAQSMNKHAEHIENPSTMSWHHVDNKNPHMDQNHSKGGISVNESCKADNVNIQQVMHMPSDKDAAHTSSHVNWFDITADTVGKNYDRLADLPTHHKIKSQAEVKEWTICKSEVLGLNDKNHRKRSDASDITDTVTHSALLYTPENDIAEMLNYTQRNVNHELKTNETYVNSPKRIETQSMVEPVFSHTDMNKRSIEAVSEGVDTNLNSCWNETFPANGLDNTTDSLKNIEGLMGWAVDQILYTENMSEEATSKYSFEHQYEDLVPAFNEKQVEHSDENNDCMIEVYVIDGDEVDENNNNTEQMVICDKVSTSIEDKSQVLNVDFGPESCLFDTEPDTGCYKTVNEHDFRPFRYYRPVHVGASDSLDCGQACIEWNDSEMSDYAEHDLNLQVHGNLLETDILPNMPAAIGINTDYKPYWDTCLIAEMGKKSLNRDKSKFQGTNNVRGSERSTYTISDVQQGHESGYNSQESPSAVYEDSYGLNESDSDQRTQNVNFVCDAEDSKNVCVHKTGVSCYIEDMNMTKSKIDTGNDGVKLAATDKKELTKSTHRYIKGGKGGGKRRKCDLCTMVEDDAVARNKVLRKLKSGQIGDRPRVMRVTEHGLILDVTEEYQDYLPYLYGC